MLLHKVVLLFLFCCVVYGQTSYLGGIIRRIQMEINSQTLCLIGFDDKLLRDFFLEPFEVPLEILSSPTRGGNYKTHERSIILVVQVSREFHNFHSFVDKIRNRKFVVIYGNTLAELHQYFSFFWEKHFTRIFGVAANTTYAYLPFADNPVQELILSNGNPLPDALRDFNGFALRTTVQADPPRAFWYTGQNGERHIGGSSGQLFVGFLKRHNATFVEVDIGYSNSQNGFAVLNGTFNGQVDISMNTFELTPGLDQSYPIELDNWAIMVPLNGYVDSSQFFLKPFQPMVWLCFGITIIYIIATDMLKDRLLSVPVDFWNSFSRIFLIFLNMPSQKRVTYARKFYIQLHLLAFICVNFYLIFMTSFLTVYIKVDQFETIQDLIDNNIPLAMTDYDWRLYAGYLYYPPGFEKILFLQNRDIFSRELESMRNTSLAWSAGLDKLSFLLKSQFKPKFHLIRENLMEFYLGFILSANSRFKEILNEFIFDIQSTGLMDKWTRNSYFQAIREGLIYSDLENVLSEQRTRPLALNHFKFAWVCFGVGIGTAIGVFVGEMLCLVFARKS